MIKRLIHWLIGCRHPNITFPITDRHTHITKVVCLSCGKEWPYSWDKMRVL